MKVGDWLCLNQCEDAERIQCPFRETCMQRRRCPSVGAFADFMCDDHKPVQFSGRRMRRHRRGGHS